MREINIRTVRRVVTTRKTGKIKGKGKKKKKKKKQGENQKKKY